MADMKRKHMCESTEEYPLFSGYNVRGLGYDVVNSKDISVRKSQVVAVFVRI